MSQHLKNNLRFGVVTFSQFTMLYVFFLAVYSVIVNISGKDMSNMLMLRQISTYFLVFMQFIVFATAYKMYTFLAIGFCSTRKANFISTQILKVVTSFEMLAIYIIFNYIISWIYRNTLPDTNIWIYMSNLKVYIILFFGMIFSASLGEFLYNIKNRLGFIALFSFIFIIIAIIAIIIAKVIFSIYNQNFETFNLIGTNTIIYMLIALIVTSIIMSFCSWLMFRKYIVRG